MLIGRWKRSWHTSGLERLTAIAALASLDCDDLPTSSQSMQMTHVWCTCAPRHAYATCWLESMAEICAVALLERRVKWDEVDADRIRLGLRIYGLSRLGRTILARFKLAYSEVYIILTFRQAKNGFAHHHQSRASMVSCLTRRSVKNLNIVMLTRTLKGCKIATSGYH